MLIPIKLEISFELVLVRDFFLWDTSDKTVTPKYFSEVYVEDKNLPRGLIRIMSEEIEEQVINTTNTIVNPFLALRKELKEKKKIEYIPITIELELEFKERTLQDKFLWNIFEMDKDVISFTQTLVRDLNLPRSSCPIIQYELIKKILTQMMMMVKAGYKIVSKNVKNTIPKNVMRPSYDCQQWYPGWKRLNIDDLRKKESAFRREQRAMKRTTNSYGNQRY